MRPAAPTKGFLVIVFLPDSPTSLTLYTEYWKLRLPFLARLKVEAKSEGSCAAIEEYCLRWGLTNLPEA